MSATAIVGINWGDEGKGRMVDLVAKDYDYVVRYQGGNNAGHTVVNEYGTHILNLLPSGIFNPGVVNVLGTGMVIDLEHLVNERDKIIKSGFDLGPERLVISDRAIICFPFHREQDELQEKFLGAKKFGSTKRGIGPVYADKYLKKGIQTGEILYDQDRLRDRIFELVEWKNLTLTKVYGGEAFDPREMYEWVRKYGEILKPFIKDTGIVLRKAEKEGKKILFEAQLGALRDIEYGIYPYTSSSSPLSAYAPLGSGAPSIKIDKVLGIMKAYSSCVGEGPFVVEMEGEEAEKLRNAGGEYGAATGRPRRVGAFDVVASRYGINCQAATEVALTKLDILSSYEEIPICTYYEIDGQRVDEFPFSSALDKAKPHIEYVKGWNSSLDGIRKFEDLPAAAKDYVLLLEKLTGCKITYISIGAERDEIIVRN